MVRYPNPLSVGPAELDASWASVPVGLLAAGGVLAFAPLDAPAARMLAITAFCICLWIGTPVAPWLTGLVGLGAIGITFSTDLALFGFGMPATWLILLGIILGEATRESGLASLVEQRVLERMPSTAADDAVSAYRYLLIAFSAIALGFVLLIPSALVRVLILGPILISAGQRFTERRARLGLFLGPLFVTFYGSTGVLTGTLGNIIITGIVESSAGVSIGWVEWLIWMGPVATVGRSLVVVAIAYLVYRPTDVTAIDASDADIDETDTARARRMLAFLLVGVLIWMTDSIHGLHPFYGALAVTVLVFLPRYGVAGPDEIADADFSIVFFLGAIFAIAEGLQRTNFTQTVADAALSVIPAGASFPVILGFVALISLALTFVMEGLAVASVLTPVFVSFAAGAGIPVTPVVMTEAVALVSYFFPYQSAVLVGLTGLSIAEPADVIKMATLCSLATILILIPLQILVFTVAY